jgi:hypothetical protein
VHLRITDPLPALNSELISNIAAVHTVLSVHVVDHTNIDAVQVGSDDCAMKDVKNAVN